jgi:hypothetical protein
VENPERKIYQRSDRRDERSKGIAKRTSNLPPPVRLQASEQLYFASTSSIPGNTVHIDSLD